MSCSGKNEHVPGPTNRIPKRRPVKHIKLLEPVYKPH